MAAIRFACIVTVVVTLIGITVGLITWSKLSSHDNFIIHVAPVFTPLDWWQHCVIYQIYPRSFKDSDGDGIGDLNGIISELEHFVESGVDAIWISSIFKSPMVDFGYDISDFYDIHEEYGTMGEFETLLKKAHALDLKVLLDFVPNHASTASQYFKDSVRGDAEFKDFFVWADGIPDPDNSTIVLPPSNWVSQFGGSSWEWNEERQQFYLHQFAVQQADFNFRNQAVQEEMFNIMKFWLNKGCDGFRIGAVPYLFEADPAFHGGSYPDDPLSGLQFERNQIGSTIPLYTKDLIEVYQVVYEWREFIDKYNEEHPGDTRVIISEGYSNMSMTMLYYGNELGDVGAHFPFNFEFISELSAKSSAKDYVYTTLKWLTYMPYNATPNWQFGNHDCNRMATRFGLHMVDGLNSLNMMLPGTSITYQGEEIGMRDGFVSWEQTLDVQARNRGNQETYHFYSRDLARTPYHWNNAFNGGFSINEKTWLPVAQDYNVINLAAQKAVDRSHYKVYQALTKLRREITFSHGHYDIGALSDSILYLVRYLSTYTTYILVFNVGEINEPSINLNKIPRLTLPATVYISSKQSLYDNGDVISEALLSLSAGESIILRADPV